MSHKKTEDRRPETDEETPGRRSSVDGRLSASRQLRPEQELAAHTLDRHVSVTAGPGAGKTTVLVERYLHLLREANISVDQIVAITFTNRSANEMRERLRRELDNILTSAEPVKRAKWMRHKRTLDSAIITTIHGFCARLLREFPVEAEIDPQFILLDAHQSAMLEEGVVEEALTEFIGAKNSAMTELAAGIGRVRLVRGLIDIYRSMRNQGLTLETLAAETAKTHKTLHNYKRAVGELAAKMREFIEARGLPPSAEEKRIEAGRRWPALHVFLKDVTESTLPAEFSDAIQGFRDATRPRSQPRVGELVKELDALIWEENTTGTVPQSFFDLHASRYAQELIKAVARIERRLDEEKRRSSALDFDDLQLRALRLLEEHPEVLRRTSSRYRFFLVDEFQDTNGLQRELMAKLALGPERQANLFIVGDRKQSIYGFRGADVDVFREMTSRIDSQNGLLVPLNRNFRSQRPLIDLFNFMFEDVFQCDASLTVGERNELGYVEHEASIVARDDADAAPLVELLVDSTANDQSQERSSQQKPRERDAEQLASRIVSLVGNESISSPSGTGGEATTTRSLEYRDIALLFRAMTEVHLYEAAFRRAGIPYVTVDGKGFYAREEITDFIQLLRFLDNKTDEVALAAVLRSPICGLSDDSLLALRCAPLSEGAGESGRIQRHNGVRHLLDALWVHESVELIDLSERPVLDRARELLEELIVRARRAQLSDLLRFAVEASEYRLVAAANFDGAQRLANIEKMFTLAERFERSGAHLIRDFVRFVRDFEETGGRESEGQIDDSADAIRLMSIHQSKGHEFPVVIIPDLHRQPDNRRDWWAVDRHRGLTLKVPDGRGRLVAGSSYTAFAERAKRRDEFESMRLLYVASTRAQDRLILSGAVKDLPSFRNSWLGWLCKAFGIAKECESGVLRPSEGVEVRLTLNLREASLQTMSREDTAAVQPREQLVSPTNEAFPLLEPVAAERGSGLHRFSVTQLMNYERCPRQYYFDRLLHAPSEDEIAIWNDAEAPEPPANLTATLRGAVIHRFCERFIEGDDLHDSLKSSFEVVLRQRAAELGDRVVEIDSEKAVHDLVPLARNYLGSKVRQRIEAVRAIIHPSGLSTRTIPLGVTSEQRFRVRRPLGILTGTIDKLLVYPSEGGGLSVEIIDFKTNRFRGRKRDSSESLERDRIRPRNQAGKSPRAAGQGQLSLDFVERESGTSDRDLLMQAEVEAVAADYQIQMQAYALAVRELIPEVSSVRVTLHFLDPDIEVSLSEELLEADACRKAIDEAMLAIVSSSSPGSFPAHPANHCRICNFRELCPPGQQWMRNGSL